MSYSRSYHGTSGQPRMVFFNRPFLFFLRVLLAPPCSLFSLILNGFLHLLSIHFSKINATLHVIVSCLFFILLTPPHPWIPDRPPLPLRVLLLPFSCNHESAPIMKRLEDHSFELSSAHMLNCSCRLLLMSFYVFFCFFVAKKKVINMPDQNVVFLVRMPYSRCDAWEGPQSLKESLVRYYRLSARQGTHHPTLLFSFSCFQYALGTEDRMNSVPFVFFRSFFTFVRSNI